MSLDINFPQKLQNTSFHTNPQVNKLTQCCQKMSQLGNFNHSGSVHLKCVCPTIRLKNSRRNERGLQRSLRSWCCFDSCWSFGRLAQSLRKWHAFLNSTHLQNHHKLQLHLDCSNARNTSWCRFGKGFLRLREGRRQSGSQRSSDRPWYRSKGTPHDIAPNFRLTSWCSRKKCWRCCLPFCWNQSIERYVNELHEWDAHKKLAPKWRIKQQIAIKKASAMYGKSIRGHCDF